MKKIIAGLIIAVGLTGCQSDAQGDRALAGGLIGAGSGALIGGLATGRAGGALAGAAIGGVGGAVIGASTAPRRRGYYRERGYYSQYPARGYYGQRSNWCEGYDGRGEVVQVPCR